MRNIFAGGGHGNAQGLQANWRNLMAAMFTPGDGGETGYQRISRFTREAGGGFDAAGRGGAAAQRQQEELSRTRPASAYTSAHSTSHHSPNSMYQGMRGSYAKCLS